MRNFLICIFCFLHLCIPSVHAQDSSTTAPQQEFLRAKVTRIVNEGQKDFMGNSNFFQELEAQIEDGNEKGKIVTIENGGVMKITEEQKVDVGQKLIVIKDKKFDTGEMYYSIYEVYRLPDVYLIIGLFFLFAILLAGWKGVGSVLGLFTSLAVIMFYIVPQILAGQNPVTVSIIGSVGILIFSTYLSHGLSKQTTVAVVSTFFSLMMTAWISSIFVNITKLTGLIDDVSLLQASSPHIINFKGLLMAGTIIGTLGALDDVTTTQAASVFELAKSNTLLTTSQLFKKGFAIGKEHVASLVNTLVLAYAGSSLIIFLFLALNPTHVPYWVILNNELTSGEIVRTAAGSIGLMLVVPIVTLLSAVIARKNVR